MRRWAMGAAALAGTTAVVSVVAAVTSHGGATAGGTTVALAGATADGSREAIVTLVTGDRVHIVTGPGGRRLVRTELGAGRKNVAFYRQTRAGEVSVIPSDAAPLITAGRVDPALFNVTRLLKAGYGDASRRDIPLIIAGTPVHRAAAPPGTTATRPLAALNGTAVTARKDRTASMWASLTGGGRTLASGGGRTLASGVGHVWLDGKVHTTLDKSVTRIGAPTAWKAGYTGKGVTVGLLDSGIDATHPDLTGAVAAEHDFTGSGDVKDHNGHGTHVASIITGDGVADPRYRGVAPDARLVVGKVLDADGQGSFSTVIAGMDWIAQQHVGVVNASLGSWISSDGTDPISAAVDALTARTGTLFVVGAGNDGQDRSVSVPGLATSALTVGAADAEDGVAGFSSRGPRMGDGAIKPDVTAPGVDITAARAAGTSAGTPVDDHYTTMSGTSMAAPHAAGAAALLLQQHPGWTPAQVKSALMTTAAPKPGVSVFAQGAGRIDVGRAVSAQVLADQGSVSFDLSRGAATRSVRFRNEGGTPVRLDLALRMLGPDGASAPSGMFAVSPATLDVPAGGTAEATVTADPAKGITGSYSGALTASRGGEETLHLAVGGVREAASREIRLTGVDRAGKPAGTTMETLPWASLTDLATGEQVETYTSGNGVAARVPAGRYSLNAVVPTGDADLALFSYPELTVGDHDVTITADARRARRVGARVDSRTAVRAGIDEIGITEQVAGTPLSFGVAVSGTTGLSALPTPKVTGHPYGFYHVANLAEPEGRRAYHLQRLVQERVPSRLDYRVRDTRLAAVDSVYHSDRPLTGRRETIALVPGVAFGAGYGEYPVRLPGRRTEFYTASPTLRWYRGLAGSSDGQGFTSTGTAPSTSRPGATTHHWNVAALGTVGTGIRKAKNSPLIFGALPFVTADALDEASDPMTVRTSVMRNDESLGSADSTRVAVTTPPGEARYTVRSTAERAASWTGLGTRSWTEWTFPYTPTMAALEEPPLFAARVDGAFDQNNRAPAGSPFALTLRITDGRVLNPGPLPHLTHATVEASYDDGATWRPAKVTATGDDRWKATLIHPAGPDGYVSLRIRLADGAGTSLKQTVIRAYGLGPN
ncbi:S8 family serine peptidase [Actinomadura barringtoniae]|uniref:S8 family serine peptidase n=1 Tax=Actinomadura barringtoniae TaxID=1427535 RepID=A0A939PE76_9ACTN|nr:S8 family serine peptidase [Actinomadura barringtoniae]MBO2448049.1 S8 family serine peptidase [Actinomadura barringtoniae]